MISNIKYTAIYKYTYIYIYIYIYIYDQAVYFTLSRGVFRTLFNF